MVQDGVMDAPRPIPVSDGGGRVDNALYTASNFTRHNPVPVAAGAFGGLALNHMAGDPLGGTVDFLTMGMTNFKPDPKVERINQVTLYNQPGVATAPQQMMSHSIPEMDEEQRKRQLSYLERKVATDLLTIEALQQQPGMGGGY
ncbi:MAG: hypothetical protein WBF90_33775 [Rivularia sp. (in: cyanobacteria)]